MAKKRFLFIRSTSVLVGTIIGAGVFGLPYAFAQSGFLVGLIYLLVLPLFFYLIKICYAEIILRTKDKLEMAGYVERYLGKIGKIVITVCLILGIFGALVAYTIGIGKFMNSFLTPIFGGNEVFWSLVFWVIASVLILKGVGVVSHLEMLMTGILIGVVFFVFLVAFPKINVLNLQEVNLDFNSLFFPYGVVLFSLGGASAIPTMRRILGKEKGYFLKRSLLWGTLITVIIYLVFCIAIIGVTGSETTETGLLGLEKFVDKRIIWIGGIFGTLTMATSFLALGFFLRQVFYKDYKIPLFWAWLLTVSVPLILFVLGLRSFILVISFAGGILSGFEGIILLITYYRAKKRGDRKPEFEVNLPKAVACFIGLILLFGIVYQFIYA